MQRRILKLVFRVRDKELDTRLKRHKILDVSSTYSLKILSLGHKMIYDKNNLPAFFQTCYKNKKQINLRNSHDFVTPLHRLRITQRSVDYIIPQLWNKLPKDIKKISKLKVFVRSIKEILS